MISGVGVNLLEAIDIYINVRRSLGAVFGVQARILNSFGREVGDIPLDRINRRAAYDFCQGDGRPTTWRQGKDNALRGFFDWLVSRGHLAASPLPNQRPQVINSFQAYIYSFDELQRLLDATSILTPRCHRLRCQTFRTLLLLLYGAGLRPGEGLRLRLCDVDLTERILTITDTKFFKARLVPIGSQLAESLAEYKEERISLPMPAGTESSFFTIKGLPIPHETLNRSFAQLRSHVGVKRLPDARWQPRVHDLRHTFAVHRLVAWYREGEDVQACLPFLATYMGHVGISGTRAYLTMTPELLTEASKRFERYSNPENGRTDND